MEDNNTESKKPVIFISWSGENTASAEVAQILQKELHKMFHGVDFFISSEIDAGTNYLDKIFEKLEAAKMGIICITKENIHKSWINYEAGAIWNAVNNNKNLVCPLLINMTTSEFAQSGSPVKFFQAVPYTEEGMLKVIKTIWKALDYNLSELDVIDLFNDRKDYLLGADTKQFEHSNESYDELTEREEQLLKLFYRSDICKEQSREGLSHVIFGNSHDVKEKIAPDFSYKEIDSLTRSLAQKGYMYVNEFDDFMVFSSSLSDIGIEYCKNNFGELLV